MVFKSTVTALCLAVMFSIPSTGWAESRAEQLLRELAGAETESAAARLEEQIVTEWSKSGSATIDLLLRRGRNALEVGKHAEAIDHFHALTDHAPDFAEGWHGLALAYYQAERFGPAMDALERALALNPQHFGALRGVGALLEQTDRPELAYRAYEKALALRPHDGDVIEAMKRLEKRALGVTL